MIEADFTLHRPAFDLHARFTTGPGVTALFGPSGSGKSTILNAIAGLETPTAGRIVAGTSLFFDSGKRKNLAPHRRRIGYVFQDALLFPHLSVAGNLRYGSRRRTDMTAIVDLLGLGALLERQPARLSGGERQRVAIGRALLSDPVLLLMDEPLASLDIARKQEILPYIESLRDRFHLPVLYVSHAIDEVIRLADQVLMVEQGRIMASGAPETVLASHLDSGRFTQISVLTATAKSFDSRYGLTTLEHKAGLISIAGRLEAGHESRIAVRATDVTLALAPPKDMSVRTALYGNIASIAITQSPVATVKVELAGGQTLDVSVTRKAIDDLGLDKGQAVWCLIKAVSIDERWLGSA